MPTYRVCRDLRLLNLTCGLEWAAHLPPGWGVCRLPSTALERTPDWLGFLGGLDDALLWHLARGGRAVVYDATGGRRAAKAVRVGVPVARAVLEHLWLGRPACTVGALVARADTPHKRAVKRRLAYHRRWCVTDRSRLGCRRRRPGDGRRCCAVRPAVDQLPTAPPHPETPR